MQNFDVVVIGAGAAMFCAGVADQRGLAVLVLDRETAGRCASRAADGPN
jgi:predicted flavoprotein YhiN